ncbi:MAG TPA: serine/threonine-protein kinase [Gemmatimonadaceae bacterium]|nr:serine/threonine-protein kinase [Gemmatimonadaceae bacterium]
MRSAPGTLSQAERRMLEERVRGYQVVREIGRGGMGVVFLARDVALHRMVAIKVLRHELLSSDDQRERFRQEARLTARLNDDGIVAVHGFGEQDDLVYIVMEYVRGEPLSKRLLHGGRTRPLPYDETRHILAALARTLEHAHRCGVVHRDLKPENVLLASDSGRPLLTDFGVALSRSADPLPSEHARAFGTPQFMSPEQAAGELDLDGRSDVYSLGVLGYLMVTGELPFAASHFAALASKHISEMPVPVRERASGVPRDLANVIDRCLEKDPSRRFAAAGDIIQHLTGVARQQKRNAAVSWFGRVAIMAAAVGGLVR